MTDDDTTKVLSLKELHARLAEQGVVLPYSSLSELLLQGDICKQLNVSGNASLRRFPLETLPILTEFIPRFKASQMKKGHAPDLLRRFLSQSSEGLGSSELMIPAQNSLVLRTPEPEQIRTVAETFADVLLERGVLLSSDRLLSREEAAHLLCCSPGSVRKYVRSVRRGKWRLSDVQGYIRGLGKGNNQ